MSLINKMLQDLDARGTPAGPSVQAEVRPVAARERAVPARAVWLGGAAVIAIAAGVLGWRALSHKPAAAPVAALAPAPVVTPLPAAAPAPAVAAPTPAPTSAAVAAPAPTSTVVAPAPVAAQAPVALQTVAAAPAEEEPSPVAAPASRAKPSDKTNAAVLKTAPAKPAESAKPAPAVKPAAKLESGRGHAADASALPADQGRNVTAQQRAENAYRRALGALQDGRVADANAGLQDVLALEPRHEAARETLVRLLLEGKRTDEAMRLLQEGLVVDPKHPAMAMLLARLQVERGGPAVETLMQTLPYALNNGEYQAFLGAVLQREQRHKEAAAHYEQALRIAPQNGVWWMGLGISLQADQRLPQAKDAFERAKAAPNLTPDLQVFVERKLQQLAR